MVNSPLGYLRKIASALLTVILGASCVMVADSSGEQLTVPDRSVSRVFTQAAGAQATGPLRVHPDNPRYFMDGSGRAILLTGSHTWSNFQDAGRYAFPRVFGYSAYLDFLQAHGHNFFRLWTWEHARWETGRSEDFWFSPSAYLRPGPGTALDGQPKFDLTQFNPAYFARLRQRVQQAGQRGLYVSVMLFDGWSVEQKGLGGQNPWRGHPFNAANNVNGIDGDPNHDGEGKETHSLQIGAITALQEAYVRQVVDTVNDLDNVLYELSNESPSGAVAWEYHLIDYLKGYEAGQPQQHPVGMTALYPGGDNADLYASPADWISPNGSLADPLVGDGRKVVLNDTDHLCGICGDRAWVWKSVLRGLNPLFMDAYDGVNFGYPPEFNPGDGKWESLRRNLGYARGYAERGDLAQMEPRGELASSGYCLAHAAASEAAYLVYLPAGGSVTVDLSNTQGQLVVEWFNPATAVATNGPAIIGGASRTLTAPFRGDAVLYIHQKVRRGDFSLAISL